jgi:hypothetical protein
MVAMAGDNKWLDLLMNYELLSSEESVLGNGGLKSEKCKCTCCEVSLPVAEGLICEQPKFER